MSTFVILRGIQSYFRTENENLQSKIGEVQWVFY